MTSPERALLHMGSAIPECFFRSAGVTAFVSGGRRRRLMLLFGTATVEAEGEVPQCCALVFLKEHAPGLFRLSQQPE